MKALELSAEDFQRLAANVVDLCAGYLGALEERSTFPQTTGAESERIFDLDLPERGVGDQAFAALTAVIGDSRVQNGRFFGYVHGSGEPIAALGDLLGSILNQNITAWRSSPAGVTIERTVVRWLSEAVGCRGFVGTLTSGGSAANLMGLAMAREKKTPANEHGLYNRSAGVVYASEQVHMAVPKAVAILGIGRENLHYVACDDSYPFSRRSWSERSSRRRRKAERQLQWSHQQAP
jgi:glutamate/tyrosine decarboxylase-like PLP-dependent enzyme